ncbi:hypothetical protein PHYPSEUDO_014172 [Phytophthora pseudosyringae]|uniref:Ig-like domain-containing protein n=1 Tax=Phytophthora pseudosyringae TaxID=221518 RepID=A0A8T1W6I1_9STRA|nr:hypothetical protein PHYPSEUDO_014172 [Phytophthora pseudosyringae]
MRSLQALLGASLLSLLLSGVPVAADETSCWEIDGAQSLVTSLAAYTGSACAVDVAIPLVAASYAPNESVALLWGVQLEAASTNAMDVPMPPDSMATLSSDHVGSPVQILSTYVRTCASRLQCTPSISGEDTFTTAQSGNFSSSDATYFETLDDLSFAEEGNYTVAAVAVLGNADNATLLYYFQTFADIVVKEVHVEAVYDSDSTYCRVTAQNPLEDRLDSNALLASSDSSEIEVVIDTNNVVQANHAFDVVWTATLARNASKDVELPSPLEAVYVVDSDGTEESGYYTIVGSVVKLCERDMACDEYSSTITVSSAGYSANFTSAGTATFNASGIAVPSTGWYDGFVQVTLAGANADSQRYDFIKYFEVYATQENVAQQVESEKYANDGSESYCWEVLAATNDLDVDATSVMFSGNSTNCPYTVNMTVSTTTFTVDAGALVSWTVAKQTSYTGTDGVFVNTTTAYDESTGQYVNLPQINVYYCNDTTCSPFSEKKTLAYSAQPMNFSERSGQALFSTKISIPSEGTYALMAHAVVPNGDGLRFDVASFMRMTVTASSASADTSHSSGSHVGLILGLTLGCASVICLAALGFAVMRRRRVEQKAAQQKESRHSFFGFRPLSNTNELPTNSPNSAQGSDESGHFMYVKAQRSPMDMPRASSLSYDPYSRRSFVEAGNEDSGYSFTFSDPEPPYPSSNERTSQTRRTPATP